MKKDEPDKNDLIAQDSWTDSFQRINRQIINANSLFQNTGMSKMLSRLSEANSIPQVSIYQSELAKITKAMQSRHTHLGSPIVDSRLKESVQTLAEAYKKQFMAQRESLGLQRYQDMATAVSDSINQFKSSLTNKRLKSINQIASIYNTQSIAFDTAAKLSGLASFQAISNLGQQQVALHSTLVNSKVFEMNIKNVDIEDLDRDVSDEIAQVDDLNALSDKAKSALKHMYFYYFLPILLSCLATYIMTNVSIVKKELKQVSSELEARKYARKASATVDRASLIGYRISTVNGLNLRESASMKGDIILVLPIGSLLEVIDKSHRSWLFVEVEVNDELVQGYVARRYTSHFK